MQYKFTNELVHESSPYLLQHAHNPVQWRAWSPAALQEAKELDKPILVSIGYAACHWCHVMERESFENEHVAKLMNEHFINIKIDREERPDLDHIYMEAVQAIAGNGGWPLNVFLTPEAKPFYGGTYFPPQKAYNRSSWQDVLLAIQDAWTTKRDEIEQQADQLVRHIRNGNQFAGSLNNSLQGSELFTRDECRSIRDNILKTADSTDGGFGHAPKFPQTFTIKFLIDHALHFQDHTARAQAELSLQKMIWGGIYDQIGGGLARYSTDNQWLVPHFEKMLYDNALLISVLCDAFQLTGNPFYADAVRRTFVFLKREMNHPDGGYFAAIDADSEGEEGRFYVWDQREIAELLGEDATLYCAYYNVTAPGNWEGKNILHITTESLRAISGMKQDELDTMIANCNRKLFDKRQERIRPLTDDKIILSWNAMLLTAYCKAYAAMQEEHYLKEAVQLESFIAASFSREEGGGLLHTCKNGIARFPAFLDDYANYIQGLIMLQEITGEGHYLQKAKMYTGYVLDHFTDEEGRFFFYTEDTQKDIIVRKVEWYDGATPSGNAVMSRNLSYLGIVFDEPSWRDRYTRMLLGVKDLVIKYPGSFGIWAATLQDQAVGMNEIAITGEPAGRLEMLRSVLKMYVPNKILQSGGDESGFPLLKGKSGEGPTAVWLCRDYHCDLPVHSSAELLSLISKATDGKNQSD